MVGTATIALERYGPLARRPEVRRRRAELGLAEVPLAVTASRSLELPVDAPLFQDPESRIVVLTNSDREPPPCAAQLIVERIPGDELDLAAGMRAAALRARRARDAARGRADAARGDARAGPRGRAVPDRLADAGRRRRAVGPRGHGVRAAAAAASCVSVLEHESFLFLRYAARR